MSDVDDGTSQSPTSVVIAVGETDGAADASMDDENAVNDEEVVYTGQKQAAAVSSA